ncbi:Carbonic anhydrase, partial [Phytophthora palmivora]
MKFFAAVAIAACALTTTNVAAAGADGTAWGYKTNDTSLPNRQSSTSFSNLLSTQYFDLQHLCTNSNMKFFAAVAIAACAFTATNVAAAGADGTAWGYKTNDTSMAGPDQWAEHYPTCGGQRQSPIDIESTAGCISEKRSLTFSGSCADFNVSQSDESFTASVDGGSCAVTANGASYNMLQFHMHVPSEHTLNGEHLD